MKGSSSFRAAAKLLNRGEDPLDEREAVAKDRTLKAIAERSVDPLPQDASLFDRIEHGPIRPLPDGVAPLAKLDPVVHHERSDATRRHPHAEAPRHLFPLDDGAGEIVNTV